MLVIPNWSLARSRVDIALLGVGAVTDRPRSARADAQNTSGRNRPHHPGRVNTRVSRPREPKADVHSQRTMHGAVLRRTLAAGRRNPATTGGTPVPGPPAPRRCPGEGGRRGVGEESV